MSDYLLTFAERFDDDAWEIEAKGWYPGATLTCSGKTYRLIFYDPFRLAQEIEDELRNGCVFFEPNLVIVPSVTRQCMQEANIVFVTSLTRSAPHSRISDPPRGWPPHQ